MKIFENYNSAKQKYGVDLVDSLTKLGLPPLYLLSACRFIKDNGVYTWTNYLSLQGMEEIRGEI